MKTQKMTFSPRNFFLFALAILTLLALISCDKQASRQSTKKLEQFADGFKTYENQGIKVVHPEDWSLLHDEPGIIADRTIAFETPEASRVSVYLYESSPRSYSDLADNLTQQLNLENGDSIRNHQRDSVEIGGFEGVKIRWVSVGLTETVNEVTILEIRAGPFPAFVQFQFFDDEIKSQESNIIPLMQGITFNPQGV